MGPEECEGLVSRVADRGGGGDRQKGVIHRDRLVSPVESSVRRSTHGSVTQVGFRLFLFRRVGPETGERKLVLQAENGKGGGHPVTPLCIGRLAY